MTAPLIGLTSSYLAPSDGSKLGTISVGESYVQAVLNAGGIPLVLPVGLSSRNLAEVFSRLDGVILTGGGDIDPVRFGGVQHSRVYGIEERRDEMEIRLVQMAAETRKPFLGICRGIQVINVALGGTLYTDITDQAPGALKHDHYPNIPRDFLAHPVTLSPGSRLAEILGGVSFPVNSLHHQALEKLAPPLAPVGWSVDNIVEAVELPGHPFGLGVQWHPEWMQAHAPQRQLFQALVQAADHL